MTSIYDQLGVRTWINAAGFFTRLGGHLLSEEVLNSMRDASKSFVSIEELQAAASTIVARHTGAEAGLITSGAAAGLTLGAAACIAGLQAKAMDQLPETSSFPNEIIIPRSHRCGYDHSLRAAGAKLVEVGFSEIQNGTGMRGLEAWEIEAAVSDQTVAIAFFVSNGNFTELETVVAVADKRKLPVIVDAGPWLPPVANLRRFTDAGASLVAFSGGKALRGPQTTGILCGKRELIASAALQQFDMNVIDGSWSPPEHFIPRSDLEGIPHHGIGRSMKVSKEDIVGLLTALESFVSRDHETELQEMEALLKRLLQRLNNLTGFQLTLRSAAQTGRRPSLDLCIDEQTLGLSALEVSRRLQAGPKPIHMIERRIGDGVLSIDPACLQPADIDPISDALHLIATCRGAKS